MNPQRQRCAAPQGVYLLTPDTADTVRLLKATQAALVAGVRWVQVRHKSDNAALRRTQACALRALTREHGAHLIVNDDAKLAYEVEADGIHVGRNDGEPAAIRALVGPRCCIGVSCYDSFERAQWAWREGVDYVAFGAMFPSRVKPGAVRASLGMLGQARAAGMHVVAIGGIDAANTQQVAAAGAHAAALISAVYDAPDPGMAAAQLITAFTSSALPT